MSVPFKMNWHAGMVFVFILKIIPMNEEIYLAGISGSLRKGSYNTMLLKAASQLLPDGVSMAFLSFADLPLYNADLDWPAAEHRPESVKRFRDLIAKAD